MKASPNMRCPCGSGAKLKKCCAIAHRGGPVVPDILMRARYTAYVIGDVDFVIDTTDPAGPVYQADRALWRQDLVEHCRKATFSSLTVHRYEPGLDEAWVTFTAVIERDGDQTFTERSRFVRHDGRWKYHSGTFAQRGLS